MGFHFRFPAACAALWVLLISVSPAIAVRDYRIADERTVERFRRLSHSPDGALVAFVRVRAPSGRLATSLRPEEARSDVWVHAPGAAAANITNGASDASGWWSPQWSPDGTRLAIFSNRGGRSALWLWERDSRRLRKVSGAPIDIYYNALGLSDEACRWIDSLRMTCVTMPGGEGLEPLSAGPAGPGAELRRAEEAWDNTRDGRLSVRVAHSDRFDRAQRNLVIIDTRTGEISLVGHTQDTDHHGVSTPSFWLSPDRRHLAYIRHDSPVHFPAGLRAYTFSTANLEIASIAGDEVRLAAPLPVNVVVQSIRWSPDSGRLAFFALEDRAVHPELMFGEAASSVRYPDVQSRDYPGRLFVADLREGIVRRVETSGIDLGQDLQPPPFLWASERELAFNLAPFRFVFSGAPQSQGENWRLLSLDGGVRDLLSSGPARMRLVVRRDPRGGRAVEPVTSEDGSLLALSQGALMTIDVASGRVEPILASDDVAISEVEPITDGDARANIFIVRGLPRRRAGNSARQNVESPAQYVLDLASRRLRRIARPAPQPQLASANRDGTSFLYINEGRLGSSIIRIDAAGEAQRLAEANPHLREIRRPERREIIYRDLNGRTWSADIFLPSSYQPGRRYPIVVSGDQGYVSGRSSTFGPIGDRLDEFIGSRDAYSFTSAGYIFLWASMPTLEGMDNIGRTNLLSFTQGILPAVEAAVAQGYADPDRTFLFGESTMGLGVFGLVTQTSRFAAAAGAMGWSDLTSKELSLGMGDRYSDVPFQRGDFFVQDIDGNLRTWRDGDLLRRNSPLSYVDRVQTPLLVITSDFDSVRVASSEMFFSALVQQRKPARFVSYLGEAHGLRTPANILDYWAQIFAWFDEWGDIARDRNGAIIFDGHVARRRGDRRVLGANDYKAFAFFNPLSLWNEAAPEAGTPGAEARSLP